MNLETAYEKMARIRAFEETLLSLFSENKLFGTTHTYLGQEAVAVAAMDQVREGDVIAQVGETGIATGPHLHFELHKGGEYLNPIYYVSLA